MDKIVTQTKQLIFSKQKGIFSSVVIISSMIILSRFFGFLRYRTLAAYFDKETLDIFFASFRIPDIIFEILITGAFTSAFIPIFIKYKKNKEELDINISSIINVIILLFLVFEIIIILFIEPITNLITPGFSQEKIQQIVTLSRLLLIGQLPFLILGNFLTGIGQANKIFILTAVAPVFYNLAIIISTIFFAQEFQLLAPVIGVIFGSLLFFIMQIPVLSSSGYNFKLIIKKTQGLIEFFQMVIPRTFTVVIAQIDATIDLILSTLVGSGSYTVFYLAQRLQLLPVSILGIAFGQAALPYLSEMYQEKKMDELKKIIVQSILNLLFFMIPIASFFIFARTPIIRLFFGGQKFDWTATVETAITLSYFSLSLPFHAIYYFVVRAFYAILNTKIPFMVGLFSVIINTVLSVFFIIFLKLPVWSMAIAFSVSEIVNVIILLYFLSKELSGLDLYELIKETTKIIICTLIPSVLTYYWMKFLALLIFDTTRTINIFFILTLGSLLFCLLYLFVSWLLNVREIYLIAKLLVKAREYRKKILEIYNPIEE